MDRIRLLLADDHPKVRTQIRARLSREPWLEVIGEAEDSATTLQCAIAGRPDILLLDPMMRDGMGLEAVGQIAARLPGTAIVVLTAFADTALRIELRKLGIRHILDKGVESHRLIGILHEIGEQSARSGESDS